MLIFSSPAPKEETVRVFFKSWFCSWALIQGRKKDQYYYLGAMRRLNWSGIHPHMSNDLKNQCSEDFDRLVTFQLML